MKSSQLRCQKSFIGINKTETGFNIYSNTGELILEYTKQNCDSLSLKLSMISILQQKNIIIKNLRKTTLKSKQEKLNLRSIMSKDDPLVSLEEIALSNMLQTEAVIRILERKGLITQDKVLEESKSFEKRDGEED